MHNYVAPLITSICRDCSARTFTGEYKHTTPWLECTQLGGAAGRSSQEANHGTHPRHETTRNDTPSTRKALERPRQLYFWKVASSALLLESGLVSFTSGKWPRQLYFWKVASSALLLESGLSLLGGLDLVPQARRDGGQRAVLPSVRLKRQLMGPRCTGGRTLIAEGWVGSGPTGGV